MANLWGSRGGRMSKALHQPSESEGFALTTALTMHWANKTDNCHPLFYDTVGKVVERMRRTNTSPNIPRRETWTTGWLAAPATSMDR